jgi:hypothetical protein
MGFCGFCVKIIGKKRVPKQFFNVKPIKLKPFLQYQLKYSDAKFDLDSDLAIKRYLKL